MRQSLLVFRTATLPGKSWPLELTGCVRHTCQIEWFLFISWTYYDITALQKAVQRRLFHKLENLIDWKNSSSRKYFSSSVKMWQYCKSKGREWLIFRTFRPILKGTNEKLNPLSSSLISSAVVTAVSLVLCS